MNSQEGLHQYSECGLDNVYLAGGYREITTPYGKAVAVDDVDGLHTAIANCLVNKPAPLSGREFRFLRIELDLSQETTGEIFGVNDRTIRKWELEHDEIAEPANTMLRFIYKERYDPDETYEEMHKRIKKIQQLDKRYHEWKLSATISGWAAEEGECKVA